jgi:hypothetical protein
MVACLGTAVLTAHYACRRHRRLRVPLLPHQPWEAEQDLKALYEKIKTEAAMDGLVWSQSETRRSRDTSLVYIHYCSMLEGKKGSLWCLRIPLAVREDRDRGRHGRPGLVPK